MPVPVAFDVVSTTGLESSPVAEALAETARRHGLGREALVALVDAREEEIDGPLDVVRTGHALADLQLAVLGVTDTVTRDVARKIAAAWLMGEGPERNALVAEARAAWASVDTRALPLLLPALSLSGTPAWATPIRYWWAAKRARY